MTQENAIDFNSQVISEKTLDSTVDDSGKYEIALAEEGDGPSPDQLPTVVTEIDTPVRRKRTRLVSRYFTLMRAWGIQQVAWEDDERISLTITAGGVGGGSFADNQNYLSDVGLISGIGVGHIFPYQVITLMDYTGPLYIVPDTDGTDAVTLSIIAVTAQK